MFLSILKPQLPNMSEGLLSGYPHIFDNIVNRLPWSALPYVGATSKGMNKRIQAIMYRHVVLYLQPTDHFSLPEVQVVDPYYFHRIPGLQLKFDGSAVHMASMARLAEHTLVIDLIGTECPKDKEVIDTLRSCLPNTTIIRIYLNPTVGPAALRLAHLVPKAAIYVTLPAPGTPLDPAHRLQIGVSASQIHGIPSNSRTLVVLVQKPQDLVVHPLGWRAKQDFHQFMWIFLGGQNNNWYTHVKILVLDDSDLMFARVHLFNTIKSYFHDECNVKIALLADYCEAKGMNADQVFVMKLKPGTPLPAPSSWTELALRPLTASFTPLIEEVEE